MTTGAVSPAASSKPSGNASGDETSEPGAAIETSTPERGWRLEGDGLVVSKVLTFEEWISIGHRLSRLTTGTAWAIGDWIVCGADGDYGRRYLEAMETFEKSFEQLEQYARICRAYPRSQRIAGVSWGHHREALRLLRPDRTAALKLALQNDWARPAFALYIDSRLGREMELSDIGSDDDEGVERVKKQLNPATHHARKWISMTCPHCGREFIKGERAASD